MLVGTAGLSASSILAACGGSSVTTATSSGQGKFPPHPVWNFVFVNHATENPFFIPTRYGIEDACALLGCKYQWTGSATSKVSEMVDALNKAIDGGVDGIALSIIDPTAFDAPVKNALAAGIPVVTYNSDAPPGSNNQRLAYIGQDLFQSGLEMGKRIVDLVGTGDVVGFIATSGSLNIQPRIDGVRQAITQSGKNINFVEVETGASVNEELTSVESYYLAHPHIHGMFAVDGGSTQSIGQVMDKYSLAAKGVHSGGYDLLTGVPQQIHMGNMDFAIDQQPYLQGYLPITQLFLYKLSGGLLQPSNTDVGLLFVTKDNVEPYLITKTRFEGSSDKEIVVAH